MKGTDTLINTIILCIVVLIAILPEYVNDLPELARLYKNNLNLYLLVALVALVSYLSIRVGILMTFLVLVLYVNVNSERFVVGALNNNASNNTSTIVVGKREELLALLKREKDEVEEEIDDLKSIPKYKNAKMWTAKYEENTNKYLKREEDIKNNKLKNVSKQVEIQISSKNREIDSNLSSLTNYITRAIKRVNDYDKIKQNIKNELTKKHYENMALFWKKKRDKYTKDKKNLEAEKEKNNSQFNKNKLVKEKKALIITNYTNRVEKIKKHRSVEGPYRNSIIRYKKILTELENKKAKFEEEIEKLESMEDSLESTHELLKMAYELSKDNIAQKEDELSLDEDVPELDGLSDDVLKADTSLNTPLKKSVDTPENQVNSKKEKFIRDTVPVVRNIEGFTSSALPEGELLTQQLPDPRTGYDVTGCRYDSVNRAQNATLNGPALDDCRAYSTKVTGECGTLFYPLNA